jgi:hypothetical protein
MPIFKEITAAKKKLYLETLAQTGSYAEAVKAAGVDPSLPHYWRRTDPAFRNAEMRAKQDAADVLLTEGRRRRKKQ